MVKNKHADVTLVHRVPDGLNDAGHEATQFHDVKNQFNIQS